MALDGMHEKFMDRAIALAETSLKNQGGPFGAVIVKEGMVVGVGTNCVTLENDPTAHAEIVAIRSACQTVEDFQLEGCEIYSSCEPCPMCLAAIYWAGIETIYYAATREDAEKIGFADNFIYQEFGRPIDQRKLPMQQLLRDQALQGFRQWEELEDKIPY